MRFLVDAQLPPALARHLEELGHEAAHVADFGMLAAADREIWRHAAETASVLITKDEDFVTMRALSVPGGPPVVWVRIGNATKRVLVERFSALMPALLKALERGETIVQIPDS